MLCDVLYQDPLSGVILEHPVTTEKGCCFWCNLRTNNKHVLCSSQNLNCNNAAFSSDTVDFRSNQHMHFVKDDISLCICFCKLTSHYVLYYTCSVFLENVFHNVLISKASVVNSCDIREDEAVTRERLADTCFTPVTHIRIAPTADTARLFSLLIRAEIRFLSRCIFPSR